MTLKESFPEASAPPAPEKTAPPASMKTAPRYNPGQLRQMQLRDHEVKVDNLLREIRDYLAEPAHWVKHKEFDRTWVVRFLVPHRVVRYCLIGATVNMGEYGHQIRIDASDRIEAAIHIVTGRRTTLDMFNDNHRTTHAKLMRVLDFSITEQ